MNPPLPQRDVVTAVAPLPLERVERYDGQLADRERSKDAGFNEHLAKPISVAQLEKIMLTAKHGISASS